MEKLYGQKHDAFESLFVVNAWGGINELIPFINFPNRLSYTVKHFAGLT